MIATALAYSSTVGSPPGSVRTWRGTNGWCCGVIGPLLVMFSREPSRPNLFQRSAQLYHGRGRAVNLLGPDRAVGAARPACVQRATQCSTGDAGADGDDHDQPGNCPRQDRQHNRMKEYRALTDPHSEAQQAEADRGRDAQVGG